MRASLTNGARATSPSPEPTSTARELRDFEDRGGFTRTTAPMTKRPGVRAQAGGRSDSCHMMDGGDRLEGHAARRP
jgi:hypothetical protein